MRILKNKDRITRATLKSFIKRNKVNIFVKVVSDFDGMTDMVEHRKDAQFKQIEVLDEKLKQSFGFIMDGVFITGRDWFKHYEDENFYGIELYNSTGTSIIAVKKTTKNKETQSHEVSDIKIVDYSDKAIAVFGNTRPIKDKLKAIGGRFNPRLKGGAGWIFPKTKKEQVLSIL